MQERITAGRHVIWICAILVVALWLLVILGSISSGWILQALMQGEGIIEGTGDTSFYRERLSQTFLSAGVVGTLFISLFLALVLSLQNETSEHTPMLKTLMYVGISILIVATGFIPRYITGDEPHYLIIAQSIATDFDVDLADEYAAVPELTPHRAVMDRGFHSRHNMGLGLLLAVPWTIAGERGAILMMNLLAVLFLLAFEELLAVYKIPLRSRIVAVLSLAGCLPVLSFASQIFPAIPGALCVTLVLTEILRDSSTQSCKMWRIVIGISFLPWLHVRFLPIAMFLSLVPLIFGLRRILPALVSLGTLVATLGVQAIFYVKWFGSPWPHAMWGTIAENVSADPLEGVLGLFLDQQFGLLWVAPIYVLWPIGIIILLYHRRFSAIPLSGVIICGIIPAISHMWWGGWSSAGRMLMPIIPCLACCVVIAYEHLRKVHRMPIVIGMFLAISLGISMVYSILPDKQRGVLGQEGQNFFVSQLEKLLHLDLSVIFPKLTRHTSPGPMWGALVWLLIWIGLVIWGSMVSIRQERTS